MNNHPTRIVIVDKDDTPIGLKERADIRAGNFYRVSAIWITNSRGDVLLAQRAQSKKDNPLKWGAAVVGTVDEGEEYLDNAVKEASEEIGLAIDPSSLAPGPKNKIVHSDRGYFCQWYWYSIDISLESLKRQDDEVAELRWVALSELKQWIVERPQDFVSGTTQWIDRLLQAHTQHRIQ